MSLYPVPPPPRRLRLRLLLPQLGHTPFVTYNFVTHHLSHTTLSHPSLSHTTLSHPSLSPTTLSHTVFHTQLCPTPSVTHTTLSHTVFHIHNLVTHHLSHTTLSHTPSFTYTTLSHTIFHAQPCRTHNFATTHNFVTHDFVTHRLSHTTLSHHLSHTTQLCHTPSFTPSFCVAGVALGDIHLHFAWQAWHFTTSTFVLRGRRGTYGTGLWAPLGRRWSPVTPMVICHPVDRWKHLHRLVVRHCILYTIFHAHNCVRHIFHTQLYPTQLFTYNFFNLSILHHLLCLSLLPRPATTFVSHYWKKSTCGVIRSFNPMICGSGGSKSRLAKAAVRSRLGR